MLIPIYVDGYPANLVAAASDALEWLKFLSPVSGTPTEASRRLNSAISCLEQHLGNLSETEYFDSTGRKDLT